jgi:hypothetical protein
MFKAPPHNDCCAIAPSDFSSACRKIALLVSEDAQGRYVKLLKKLN